VLAAADRAVEITRRSARGEVGTLNIGFFNGGTGPDVPAIIKDFRRLHPGVRVAVTDVLPGLQSNALIEGTLDVGFTRPLETPFDQLLRAELLYLDPLVAVLPKDHPLVRGPVNLKSLARERFVLVARESSPSLFGKILATCSKAGFSPNIVATGAVWASVALLVEAGEGIAILPSNLQHGASRNLKFCPLTNRGAAIGLVIAWSPQREGPVLKEFLKLVSEYRRWPLAVGRLIRRGRSTNQEGAANYALRHQRRGPLTIAP
jgi:DNA-binding transcriptional LysR family regulator